MPLLPHNIEIEQSLLGSILINNDAIMQAVETLSGSSDFYQPIHRIIYDAMLKLFEQNEPIDLLTLSNILKKVGKVSVDDAYLAELNLAPPSATNAQIYAKIIHNKAMLRNLIKVSNDVASLAYEDREDVGYVIDKAESMIFDIAQNKVKKSFNPISTIIKQGVELVEQLYERKELITGVPTGYKDLDEKTSGLQPSDLIIIAGRPSMGKTAFALNIAQNFSLAEPEAVIAIFSLEMSNAQLSLRLLSSQAQVSSQKIRSGYISKSDWPKITTAAAKFYETNIFIDDSPTASALDIKAKTRRLRAERKRLDLVIVDYLQLMTSNAKTESRNLEISEITRSLKQIAKELEVPVIAISQLSRKVEERSDKRPQLADLRESGSIEQDADLVMFVYRKEFYDPKNLENENMAEVIIGKQRNGPLGNVKLAFLKDFTRFENLAPELHTSVDSYEDNYG